MTIYPTPSKGKFFIEGDFSDISKAFVKDADGKLVLHKAIINNRAVLDLSHCADGEYDVSVVTDNEVVMHELIRKGA